MARALCSLIAVLGLSICAPCRASTDTSVGWFQSTTQALYDAVAGGDTAVWDRVLDESCMITTEDGEVIGKPAFLKQMRPLPRGFSGRIRVRDLTVRRAGPAAIVHYWLDETEDIFDQRLKTVYVETDVYRRAGGGWRMLAAQVTVVPRDLEPIGVDSELWPALEGEYRLNDAATSRYQVFVRDGALYGGGDRATATRLIPLAPLVFFQQGSIHTMIFVRDRSGAITEVRELHKYNEVRLKRVGGSGSRPASP
ncbi:MAG TPA: nuclear transport factor 2 family protein [Steroidobacteraceae bacterium]|nr:nuclear transport factor 2 family protein [Steroidobacteraceae bacterium]